MLFSLLFLSFFSFCYDWVKRRGQESFIMVFRIVFTFIRRIFVLSHTSHKTKPNRCVEYKDVKKLKCWPWLRLSWFLTLSSVLRIKLSNLNGIRLVNKFQIKWDKSLSDISTEKLSWFRSKAWSVLSKIHLKFFYAHDFKTIFHFILSVWCDHLNKTQYSFLRKSFVYSLLFLKKHTIVQ